MNNKFLKFSVFIFILALFLVIISLFMVKDNYPSRMSYQPVFKEFSGDNISLVKHIRLQNKTSDTNIVWENNGWQVVEEDGYPANIKLLSFLLDFIQNGVYYRKIQYSDEALDEYKLQTSGENAGTILTIYTKDKEHKIIIGKTTEDYIYGYVRYIDDDEIWMVDKAFQAPRERYSWLNQPILSYNGADIASIETKDWKLERNNRGGVFRHKGFDKDASSLVNPFIKLYTTQAVKTSNIDEKMFEKHRKLFVKDFEGLITEIDIYGKGSEYWASIKIYSDALPTVFVDDYIKNNTHRYEDWFFKLVDFQGDVLLNYKPE